MENVQSLVDREGKCSFCLIFLLLSPDSFHKSIFALAVLLFALSATRSVLIIATIIDHFFYFSSVSLVVQWGARARVGRDAAPFG